MEEDILSIENEKDFNHLALKIFQLQYSTNWVYKNYCDLIHIDVKSIDHYSNIPFLPIQFFKSQKVLCEGFEEETIFQSSGTGGQRSKHFIANKDLYERSFMRSFEAIYGKIEDLVILALLPSYLEQGDSSLVYMCDQLIQRSKKGESGFFLNNTQKLAETLKQLKSRSQKTVLIGVSYALIDFVDQFPALGYEQLTVMETGGMKGRKKEIVREELHDILKEGFGVKEIHSEYGMTELLSQAYATSSGKFKAPKWMKVLIRKQEDPFAYLNNEIIGGINVIDLANLYSCSFIQTDDLGKSYLDSFEVLGRFDNAEIRGCSQLAI